MDSHQADDKSVVGLSETVLCQFFPELAGTAMFNITEDPVEVRHAVEAAGEADFRYAPAGVCHEFFRLFHTFSLNRLYECHS